MRYTYSSRNPNESLSTIHYRFGQPKWNINIFYRQCFFCFVIVVPLPITNQRTVNHFSVKQVMAMRCSWLVPFTHFTTEIQWKTSIANVAAAAAAHARKDENKHLFCSYNHFFLLGIRFCLLYRSHPRQIISFNPQLSDFDCPYTVFEYVIPW